MSTPPDGTSPTHADVPVPTGDADDPFRTSTAATTPTSSTTSTPTACPTGWSSTPTALHARARAGGRDGRGLERLVRDGLPGRPGASRPTTPTPTATSGRQVRPAPASTDPHPADRLPGRQHVRPPATGTPGAGAGGYTYGDFGKIIGGARGARRRRDLGADAVGPAHGARQQGSPSRWSPGRWSCRRPTRRSSTCATRSCRPTPVVNGGKRAAAHLEGLRAPRHGLLRRRARRRRRRPGRGLLAAAGAPSTPRGSLTGDVTDAATDAPVAGRAASASAGTPPGFPGTTPRPPRADGTYTDRGILPGTYPKVYRRGAATTSRSARCRSRRGERRGLGAAPGLGGASGGARSRHQRCRAPSSAARRAMFDQSAGGRAPAPPAVTAASP